MIDSRHANFSDEGETPLIISAYSSRRSSASESSSSSSTYT